MAAAEIRTEKNITATKFPPEVRRMVYLEYLTQRLFEEKPQFLHYRKTTECNCGSHATLVRRREMVELALAFTNKQVSAEVLPLFYCLGTIVFCCPCEVAALSGAEEGRLRGWGGFGDDDTVVEDESVDGAGPELLLSETRDQDSLVPPVQ